MDNFISVIDLGTNTCNLLVAEYEGIQFNILHQSKELVKLGKEGIHKNLLSADGLNRTILAIQSHQKKIAIYPDIKIIAFATSAIREAHNRDWFVNAVREHTGIKVLVISGEKEADLIYKGVKLAFETFEDNSLILDIGGGSNEFILIRNNEPVWKKSFPLGMARIISEIPPSDPITDNEILRVEKLFDTRLNALWKQLENNRIPALIGCSGAFDTLADLIDQTEAGTKIRIFQELKMSDFEVVCNRLIASTTAERMQMRGMESIRVEMIVPAVLFIRTVIRKLNINKIIQTDFALREGVLYEHIFS